MDRETTRHQLLNRGLNAGLIGLQLLQLAVMPLWLLPRDAAWGWLLLLPVLLTNSWWAFVHEAIHGSLTGDRERDRRLGRLHGVLLGAGFDLLRWGHLLHHALSRTRRERSEVMEPEDSVPAFVLGYYFRLLGGLYLLEVLASLLLLLPRALLLPLAERVSSARNPVAALMEKMLQPDTLAAARRDILLAVLVYALAFALYGPHAWMLALTLVARGLLISLMDNVWHYDTPLEDPRYARNLWLPAWARLMLLNFNLHGLHHLRPALPWWQLAGEHRASGAGYQGSLPGALLAQLRGPIPETRLRRPTA